MTFASKNLSQKKYIIGDKEAMLSIRSIKKNTSHDSNFFDKVAIVKHFGDFPSDGQMQFTPVRDLEHKPRVLGYYHYFIELNGQKIEIVLEGIMLIYAIKLL